MSKNILIVDDESSIQSTLMAALGDEGLVSKAVGSGEDALDILKKEKFDIILLDIWMPGMDGLETLKKIKKISPEQLVVIMSGHGTIETAVKATKLGALDFIEKPLSLERLLVIFQNAWTVQELARENQALRKQVQKSRMLLGESPQIAQIREMIKRVAPTTGSVLITGENGTGKEVVAQSIHALSTRFGKAFVEVNCAAIPEELIESELFGHEKGAFTGATQQKRGKFDLANGGTLFLDEIGDMSLKTQAKILRILQEQKFERVGGTQTISGDVRIIAATNKDLKIEIQRGNFREDLFYRLNVVPFYLPPLRERKGDAAILADYFIRESCVTLGRELRVFSEDALKILQAYSWPGNIRELKNLVDRIMILTGDADSKKPILASELLQHLGEEFSARREVTQSPDEAESLNFTASSRSLRDARYEFEKEFIVRTLKENDWNVSKTASILGIERTHLHRKMKGFGIEAPEEF